MSARITLFCNCFQEIKLFLCTALYTRLTLLAVISPHQSGPCPKVHTLNIAVSKLHTVRYGKDIIAHLENVQCFL